MCTLLLKLNENMWPKDGNFIKLGDEILQMIIIIIYDDKCEWWPFLYDNFFYFNLRNCEVIGCVSFNLKHLKSKAKQKVKYNILMDIHQLWHESNQVH